MKLRVDLEPLFPDRTSSEPLGSQLLRRLRDGIRIVTAGDDDAVASAVRTLAASLPRQS